MRAVAIAFLLLGACASLNGSRGSADEWTAVQDEVLDVVAGTAVCGPTSLKIGFCRKDLREVPTEAEAALSDACRAQPAAHLALFGQSPSDLNDRKATVDALRRLFGTPPFGGPLERRADRTLLKMLHDRDQALRFFRPEFQAGNRELVEHGKWVAICAHALFARKIIDRVLARTTPQALASDEELANYAWLLVQHSDFDPEYQLRMSTWFGSADTPRMKIHAAYLHDRAMVGLGRPQRFGTQLRCNEGIREPFPVKDPAGMDARRIVLGLKPMKDHLATFPRPCPPPQLKGS